MAKARSKRRKAQASLKKMMKVIEPFLPKPDRRLVETKRPWRLEDERVRPPKGTHCEAL